MSEAAYQETLFVTQEHVCLIKSKRIEYTYNASLSVKGFLQPEKDRYEIVVKGPSAELVSAAKKEILESETCTLKIEVKERLAGRIRGRGGATLRRLEEEFVVRITLNGGKIRISGRKSRVESARKAIIDIIADKRKSTN